MQNQYGHYCAIAIGFRYGAVAASFPLLISNQYGQYGVIAAGFCYGAAAAGFDHKVPAQIALSAHFH